MDYPEFQKVPSIQPTDGNNAHTYNQSPVVEEASPSRTFTKRQKVEHPILSKENHVNTHHASHTGNHVHYHPRSSPVVNFNSYRPRLNYPPIQQTRKHHCYHYTTQQQRGQHAYFQSDAFRKQGSTKTWCIGCLSGSSDLHMKLFHSIVSEAIYASQADASQLLATQLPGYAFVHDGLAFRWEHKNKLTVRATNCSSWVSDAGSCRACNAQVMRLHEKLQTISNEHEGDPAEMAKYTPLERIKLVPTLAEARIQTIVTELDEYEDSGVSIFSV